MVSGRGIVPQCALGRDRPYSYSDIRSADSYAESEQGIRASDHRRGVAERRGRDQYSGFRYQRTD